MFIKLLKYDLQSMFKNIVPIYIFAIICLVFSLITNLLSNVSLLGNAQSLIYILYGIINFILAVAIIAMLIMSFFIGIRRFYQNVLKDEGYLTNTLPVNKSAIVLAKLSSSALLMIFSSIFALIIGMIGSEEIRTGLTSGLSQEIFAGFNGYMLLAIVAVVGLLQAISYTSIFYNALSIGYSRNGNKNVNSIVTGIIIYFITQVVALSILVAFIFYLDGNAAIFAGQDNEMFFVIQLLALAGVINIASILINYFITVRMLNKRLNLE